MGNTATLDPELVPFVENLPFRALDPVDLAKREGIVLGQPVELSDAVERTDHVVSEDPYLVVRVHRPKGVDGPLPCLYSIHGGGYVIGSYVMDDARFDVWCPKFNCVGVSVEYRLAPETPYPGPLEDCYAGLKWTFDNADTLGIRADHIGIGGVSAGGGLAAALALLARDRAEFNITFQLLECPMLDDRQITPSSNLDDLLIWSRESNTYGWKSYLGALYGTNGIPAHAAPARAHHLEGLPPAMVIVGGADGFRDEDIDYALRLGQAGVPTELHVLPGAPHGVGIFAGTGLARRWQSTVDDWVRRQLGA